MTWMQEPKWAHLMVHLRAMDIWVYQIWVWLERNCAIDLPYDLVAEAVESIQRRVKEHTDEASHGGAWRDLDPYEVLALAAYVGIIPHPWGYRRCIFELAGVDNERTLLPRRPVEPKEYYQANFKPLF